MEAILAGRQDLAFKLADLGFISHAYAASINQQQSPPPACNTSHPDAFSGNARFIKAAICAGALITSQSIPDMDAVENSNCPWSGMIQRANAVKAERRSINVP